MRRLSVPGRRGGPRPDRSVRSLGSIAGGRDVFGESGRLSHRLDREQVLEKDPSVLVLHPCGWDMERTRAEIEGTGASAVSHGFSSTFWWCLAVMKTFSFDRRGRDSLRSGRDCRPCGREVCT
jgi:hypothetical protein